MTPTGHRRPTSPPNNAPTVVPNAGGLRGTQPPEGTGGRATYSGVGQGPRGTASCHIPQAKASPMAQDTVSRRTTPHPFICSRNPLPDNPLARPSPFLPPSSSRQRPPSLDGGRNAGEIELASGTHRERLARVTPTNRDDAPSLCGRGSLTCEVRPQLPARPTASRGFSRPVRPAIETPQPSGLLATAIAPLGRRTTITRTGPQGARTLYPRTQNPSTHLRRTSSPPLIVRLSYHERASNTSLTAASRTDTPEGVSQGAARRGTRSQESTEHRINANHPPLSSRPKRSEAEGSVPTDRLTLRRHRGHPSHITNRPGGEPRGLHPLEKDEGERARAPLTGGRGGVGHCIDPLPAVERVPEGPAHPLRRRTTHEARP